MILIFFMLFIIYNKKKENLFLIFYFKNLNYQRSFKESLKKIRYLFLIFYIKYEILRRFLTYDLFKNAKISKKFLEILIRYFYVKICFFKIIFKKIDHYSMRSNRLLNNNWSHQIPIIWIFF